MTDVHKDTRQRIIGPSLPELVDRLGNVVPEVSGEVAASSTKTPRVLVVFDDLSSRLLEYAADDDDITAPNGQTTNRAQAMREAAMEIKRLSAPTVPMKKSDIESEYHRQVRHAGVEPRLMTFDAFISGVRFAERVHGITELKE